MKKNIFLNTLYTLCIFVCLILAWTGIKDKHYEYVAAGVFGLAIFGVLKVRLIKEVRKTLK
ncbi:DUF6358 family protein [Mucilaginibacter panaciglaebae]|uniref:DUF6358 family protein n=1 Tax=Mucilaginibacter panaciglaebae TaxID=502331 RepID=UPI0031EFBF30